MKRFIIMSVLSTVLYIIWFYFGFQFTGKILGEYILIFNSIISGFILILWSEIFYYYYDKFVNYTNNKSLEKSSNKTFKPVSYYKWLSNLSFDEKSFNNVLSGNAHEDYFKNLKKIRNILSNKIGNNIEDYYLVRNSLEHIKNEISAFSKIVQIFIIPFFISFITYHIIKRPEITNNLFIVPEFGFIINVISVLCIIIAISIVVTRGIKSAYKLTATKERTLNALLFVINSIISEKEFKNN